MLRTLLLGISTIGLIAGSAFLASAQSKPATPTSDAIASPLEGDYTIESGEKDGKAIPADHFKGSIVQITASAITGTDKDRKEFFACTYTLDGKTEPWTIRMKSTSPKTGEEAMGLVKRSGDTVTLIYALPGGDMPSNFKTKEKQHMFVLKNARAQLPAK